MDMDVQIVGKAVVSVVGTGWHKGLGYSSTEVGCWLFLNLIRVSIVWSLASITLKCSSLM